MRYKFPLNEHREWTSIRKDLTFKLMRTPRVCSNEAESHLNKIKISTIKLKFHFFLEEREREKDKERDSERSWWRA
jgi:hypothetical protein